MTGLPPAQLGDSPGEFRVELDNFSGPFDLLLQLIAKHRLDITEVALAAVTDEFLAYAHTQQWELSEASQFLVVAATLLDLKAYRLLPRDPGSDDFDLDVLEARDLLFARLLQYRAYKEVAGDFADAFATTAATRARAVAMEPQFAQLLPELIWSIGPSELAAIAAGAFTRTPPHVHVDHLHHPRISVPEQAKILVAKLQHTKMATFAQLIADAPGAPVVVARFLALLELYRDHLVDFRQDDALASLHVVFRGDEHTRVELQDEYDKDPS
ncbi:MAG: ScpA family protein [Bowdeniella nasicola]|nr:ScpA family protein [Bowdeniella nasicola]